MIKRNKHINYIHILYKFTKAIKKALIAFSTSLKKTINTFFRKSWKYTKEWDRYFKLNGVFLTYLPRSLNNHVLMTLCNCYIIII